MTATTKERAPSLMVKQKLEGAFMGGIDALTIAIKKIGLDDCRKALRGIINATANADDKAALLGLYASLYPSAGDPTKKGTVGLRDELAVSENGTVHFSGIPLGAKASTKESKQKVSKQVAKTAEGFVCAIVATTKATVTTQKMNDGRECVVIVPSLPATAAPPPSA